jgi:membrane fusion protein, multidrug efflux system
MKYAYRVLGWISVFAGITRRWIPTNTGMIKSVEIKKPLLAALTLAMMEIAGTILCTIFLVSLIGCSKQKPPTIEAKHVDTQTVYSYDVPYIINYPAIVQGVVDYQVIPRVSGVIYKKYYKEGAYVKKDQPLYEIDPRPFELDLKNYQGQLVKDKAAQDNLKIIYERYVDLYKDKAVSKQDVESARISYMAAVGNVQSDVAKVNQAKLNLLYCLVRSPATGYIAERLVTVGTMVTAFQTILNHINSVNDMYLLFSMPENQRIEIENGVIDKIMSVPAKYTFRTDIQLADGKMIKNAGYVEFTDTRIGLQNGVWSMRAYVDNNFLKNKLLAGQYVTVYIHGIKYLNIFTMPQAAILRDDKSSFVYLLKNGKAIKQYVVTGKMLGGHAWIVTSGLKNGDTVITSGNIRIHDGSRVTVDKQIDSRTINESDNFLQNNNGIIKKENTEVAKNTSSKPASARAIENLNTKSSINLKVP